jgi:hypothetical protein
MGRTPHLLRNFSPHEGVPVRPSRLTSNEIPVFSLAPNI